MGDPVPMTATPTPAEREKAKQLAYSHHDLSPLRVAAIAQALADVRAEAEARGRYTGMYRAARYIADDGRRRGPFILFDELMDIADNDLRATRVSR